MTDTLLYVCMYVCVCIVGFDLLFAYSLARSERMLPKRKKEVRELLESQMQHIENDGAPDESLQETLRHKLLREDFLLAFIEVCETLKAESTGRIAAYFMQSLPMFSALADQYGHKSDEYKAMFAYALSALQLGRDVCGDDSARRGELSSIGERIMPQVMNGSIYVRENTVKAIISLGSTSAVISALSLLNSEPAYQNSKLLSDELLSFTGDCEELIRLLWSCFDQFTPTMQVMLINYLRLLPLDVPEQQYFEDVRALLSSAQADVEVRIAAIRYFRRRVYEKAYPDLIRLLLEDGPRDSHFSAIAATTLQSYPGEKTEEALMSRLGDPDWYTRLNCAESLTALGVDYEKTILSSSDRYAKEMLIYRSEVYKLRKRSRVSA